VEGEPTGCRGTGGSAVRLGTHRAGAGGITRRGGRGRPGRHQRLLCHCRRRRWRHDLRRGRLRRRHARGAAGQADRRRRGRPERRVLASGLRRRRVLVRQRAVLGLDGRHGAQQAHRGHDPDAGRRRLLAGRLRRGHLRLRRRAVLRFHRRFAPQQADRGDGRRGERQRLLAGRLRRRHLRLRCGPVLRLHRRHQPEQARGGDGRHRGRQRLLAGRLRRRHLHLWRRPVLRLHRRHPPQRADRRHDTDAGRGRVLAGRPGRRCLRLRRCRVLGERAIAPPSPALSPTPVESDSCRRLDHQRGARPPGHPPGRAAGGLLRGLALALRGQLHPIHQPALCRRQRSRCRLRVHRRGADHPLEQPRLRLHQPGGLRAVDVAVAVGRLSLPSRRHGDSDRVLGDAGPHVRRGVHHPGQPGLCGLHSGQPGRGGADRPLRRWRRHSVHLPRFRRRDARHTRERLQRDCAVGSE